MQLSHGLPFDNQRPRKCPFETLMNRLSVTHPTRLHGIFSARWLPANRGVNLLPEALAGSLALMPQFRLLRALVP